MARWNIGTKNGFWKGGRSVASNGYVLVRMPEHPNADCRGYVYEHILVMSRLIGRPLSDGEEVHHSDENHANNDPNNLVLCASHYEHRYLHRRMERGLRNPGEDNPLTHCGCGCGETFPRYDKSGRPRRFVTGHNPQQAEFQERLLISLKAGLFSADSLAAELGSTNQNVRNALSRLKAKGLANNVVKGRWEAQSGN